MTATAQLHKVAAISSNDVWAVGHIVANQGMNQTLAEHWDGGQWSIVPSPNMGEGGTHPNYLLSVATVSPNDVWAVGYYISGTGTLGYDYTLTEHWDGGQWSIVPSPNPTSELNNVLEGITAVSANDIWAVGIADTAEGDELSLTEHWDGIQWSIVPSPNPPNAQQAWLYGATAVASNNVWAVGHERYAELNNALIEHWNGTQWNIVPAPDLDHGFQQLNDIQAISADNIWAVGYYATSQAPSNTLVEHWDGAQWTAMTAYNPALNDFLNGVAVAPTGDVWATGYYRTCVGCRADPLTVHYYDLCVTPSPTPTSTNTPMPTITPTVSGTPPTATPTSTPCANNGNYQVATSTTPFVSATTDTGNHCDDCTTAITLPFTFQLYNQASTSAVVSSNGTLQFAGNNPTYSNNCLPDAALTHTIMPFWDDLQTDCQGCGIFTSVTGTSPNRVFTIEWIAHYYETGGLAHFEVKLYEQSPLEQFDVVYAYIDDAGASATIGVQEDLAQQPQHFTQYTCDTGGITPGLLLTFTRQPCLEPTITPTYAPTVTATAAPAMSATSSPTLLPTNTPGTTGTATPTSTTPTATPTPCAITFTDVYPTDYFYDAVQYLYCHGAISGYSDNTFRPYNNVTRGQLCKIVVLAEGWDIVCPPTGTFVDVLPTSPFYCYIETAARHAIISGYSDGTFRPYNNVTRGQLTKLIVLAEQWAIIQPTNPNLQRCARRPPILHLHRNGLRPRRHQRLHLRPQLPALPSTKQHHQGPDQQDSLHRSHPTLREDVYGQRMSNQ